LRGRACGGPRCRTSSCCRKHRFSATNGPEEKVKHPTPPPNPAVAEAEGSRLSITKPVDGNFAPYS
jgi:hypothetical protein